MKAARVLTIAGSDSGGGAGIQADLKTISALGGFGMTVITVLTAQNTIGVQGVYEIPPDFVETQFDSVATDIGVDAAKTGMLASSEIIRIVAKKVRQYGIERLVVDPVMVAKGGKPLIQDEAKKTLTEVLLPLAMVVTPNVPEAEVLAGLKISIVDDMKKAAKKIHGLGAKYVVVKGGHLPGDAVDVFYDGKAFHTLFAERIETKDTHGTGCTFAAAIATGLAGGKPAFEAVKEAKDFVTKAIRFSLRIGGGHGPANPFGSVLSGVEHYACLDDLRRAIERLKEGRCGDLVPEVQSNIGYALPQACSADEVAAVPGRLIRVGHRIETLHDPAFGASRHIAKVILAIMAFNPAFRSAMNIRYSEEIIRACRDLGFDVDYFSRSDEPLDVKEREGSSLEWGTKKVLARRNSVPDVIYDKGDVGKEPMVRILGENPGVVVEKVLKIAGKLQ
ncbi:MAG: bifunctional hydroxymethylpyrimidine kinase/phosphomethylpyrimidine kinase [Deltaproteobacteria bacterium]|nr:bifunctional hydroxymethylpyrimidine kinase/phosphomethylpyrimidine kinase [Deltaproteobacteria bacterium]